MASHANKPPRPICLTLELSQGFVLHHVPSIYRSPLENSYGKGLDKLGVDSYLPGSDV